jgi:putative transposase
LVFPDESGFSLVSPLKRTWARRGQTPVLRMSIEHNQRLNLIGAWCLTPARRKVKVHLQSSWSAMSGAEVILFLKHLLRHVRGSIIMLWDKHPIHKRKMVTQFLDRHPRIDRHWFPTCAPELNPMEFVWTQVSESTASTAPHNVRELESNVRRGIARTRVSQRRLWACIEASGLPWKRNRPKDGH